MFDFISSYKFENNEKGNFGFSFLPIYSFKKLSHSYKEAAWLGRSVYVMQHLFGTIPFLSLLTGVVNQFFSKLSMSKSDEDIEPIKSAAHKHPFEDERVMDSDEEHDAEDENNISLDDDLYQNDDLNTKEMDDFAFYRTLQEESYALDLEENFDSDEAERLQAEFYEEDLKTKG